MNRPALAPDAAPSSTDRWRGRVPCARFRWCAAAALACAVALAGALLAGCGAAHSSTPPRATHATHTASPVASLSPTSAATVTATATDIPLVVLTGATLGGTATGFTATYGVPSGPDRWDAHGISFTVTLATGTDGLPHVVSLAAQPGDGSAWTLAQAQQACTAFLPPDAIHARDTTTASGDQEAIYLSAHLGSTFLPSAFGDASPGTLAIDYAPAAAGGIARCGVVAGTV